MKRRLAILTLAALGIVGSGTAPAFSESSQLARPASVIAFPTKSCGSGYVRARIGGEIKCLRRGQYCAVRYRKDYARYGFRCVYYGGAYRLK